MLRTLFVCILTLPLLLASFVFGNDSTFVVDQWLITGPLELPNPLFADSSLKPERALELLDFDFREQAPHENMKFTWSPLEQGMWESRNDDTLMFKIGGMAPYTLFAATYLESERRQELALSVNSARPVAAWLDGKSVGKQTSAKEGRYELSGMCDLHTGKHLLILKITSEPSLSPQAVTLAASLKVSADKRSALSCGIAPRRELSDFKDWAQFDGLAAPAISSDGALAAVVQNERDEKYKLQSWLKIFSLNSAKLLTELRTSSSPSGLFFLPDSPVLAYQQSSDDGIAVWGYNTATGEIRQLMAPRKNVTNILCSPDGKFFYFFQDDEEKENKSGYTKFDEIEDRVDDIARRRRLIEYCLADGVARALNELGTFAMNEMAISKEGTKLAFTRWIPRTGRPYYNTELWIYELNTRHAELILSLPLTEGINNICFAPGGRQIMYSAGSHLTQPQDTVFHNVNQHCLFQLDLASKQISNLTAREAFSIAEGSASVRLLDDGRTLLLADNAGKVQLLQSAGGASFSVIQTANSFVEHPRYAENGTRAVFLSSRLDRPMTFSAYDFKTKSETILLDPNKKSNEQLGTTSYEDWTFKNSDGYEIDGWIMKPIDFNPEQKYPLIVYYYGGVSPRDERFSFTYQWWCANGYVVYILNPRGCVGYGQEFADFHSNDWGTEATQDVIEGTQKVLAEHSFLDPKRIGAYGGSYGGFITLDLATKTDMFTALIDMYGISNIASYFGGGTWGYWYGDLALPGSLPWKDKDIFVEKSPLYHADKIKTPMLILHGAADNNVPPTESDQMFVALKILGQDVAYVRFEGEHHNIVDKFDNLIAHREMMLEWFDKYLKGEPEGWEKRWKE